MWKRLTDGVGSLGQIDWWKPFEALIVFAFTVTVGIAETATIQDAPLQSALLEKERDITQVAIIWAFVVLVVLIVDSLLNREHRKATHIFDKVLTVAVVLVFGRVAWKAVDYAEGRLLGPNLRIMDVSSNRDAERPDAPPGLIVRVKNTGRSNSPSCKAELKWVKDGGLVAGLPRTIKELTPGSEGTILWDYTRGEVPDGRNEFCVKVDSATEVDELDEHDNDWMGSVRVILEVDTPPPTPTAQTK